jgi:glycosyltransferase involved in cell wall biosynthesis
MANVWVIIPAYNEKEVIGQTISGVKKYCGNVLVVDDGSRDGTAEKAAEAGSFVLRHIINRGQGAALRTGIKYALREGADIIITYDADGQFEAAEIEKIIAPVVSGEYQITLGSRFIRSFVIPELSQAISGIQSKNNIPFTRKITLKAATLFTRIISGLAVSDTHNGFRAISREAAKKINIRQDRMAHSSEIIQEISRLGLKYKEVPVTVKYTDYSRRKGQKIAGALKILFDLIFK